MSVTNHFSSPNSSNPVQPKPKIKAGVVDFAHAYTHAPTEQVDSFKRGAEPESADSAQAVAYRLQWLLENEANPNQANPKGVPLASQLVKGRLANLVMPLLGKHRQWDPLVPDIEGQTTLDYAANWGSPRLVNQLLEKVSTLKASKREDLRDLKQKNLQLAGVPDQERQLQQWLEAFERDAEAEALPPESAEVDTADYVEARRRETLQWLKTADRIEREKAEALQAVAQSQLQSILRLQTDLDTNKENRLFHAIGDYEFQTEEKQRLLYALLAAKTDVNAKQGMESVLHRAAARGYLPVVKTLLDENANFNVWESNGKSPLHLAAENSRPDVVQHLIQEGMNVDIPGSQKGRTPLFMVALAGNVTMTKQLLALGADPNKQDNDRNSVLHAAAQGGDLEVVLALLEANADRTLRNNSQKTPLDLARNLEHVHLFPVLTPPSEPQAQQV